MDALRRGASVWRLAAVLAALAGLVLTAIVVPNARATGGVATPPCQVTDQVNQWAGGFTSTITVTNNGPAIAAWTVTWTFATQHVTSAWSARVTQTGTAVTATNESYNGAVPAGGSVSFGFQAKYSGANDTPVDFAVNGQSCDGSSPPTSTTTTTTTPGGSGCSSPTATRCDGFEDQTGPTPAGRWNTVTPNCAGTGTATIATTTAHSGTHSLQVNGADGYCNHVFVDDTTDQPAANTTWYVRFWIRHTTPLPTGHVTFLALNDGAAGNTDLRLGGQNGALMWNRQSDDATLPDQSPAGVAQSVQLPVNAWTCVEFSVGAADGQIHTWVNGSTVPGLTEDGVPTPNIDDQWLGRSWRPKLTDLKLGWESYGGGGPDGLWFDDVALGTSRLGCG